MKPIYIVLGAIVLALFAFVILVFINLPKVQLKLPNPENISFIEVIHNDFDVSSMEGKVYTVEIRDPASINEFYRLINPSLGSLGVSTHPAMTGQSIKIYSRSEGVIRMSLQGNKVMVAKGKIKSNLDVGVFQLNNSELAKLKKILNITGEEKKEG